ncbi:hypothetical protein [Sphingobium sp. HWE2-09]|uniref:hypothetical protein n=1 Tax=Sphingobium sp. HWE2-09 TaxID=3108390 RepID=UPI002DC555A6|nr:hypothetical protein [Sphingobium sp. HWE2-09]
MNSTIAVADQPLPTLRRLNRAVLIAAGAAALIATTIVLPAEYGIDPTGVGRVLGLTRMGEMKVAQAGGGAAAPAGPVAGDSVTDTPDGGKRVQFVIGPYGGREAKAVMQAGAQMTYDWSTDGAAVEYEFHGDPDVPKKPGDYSSYEKGTKVSAKGRFKAGFAGHHGWFWKNLTAKPVVVTAIVKGGVATFEPIYAQGENAATAATAATTSKTAVDATPYSTQLPLKQFMRDVMSHAATEVWKRQGYISDDKGVRSLFPKNDAEWKDAENAALTLSELTNILLIPGRRVDEKPWTDGVVAVRTTALKLATLARKKDEEGYMVAGSELNEACYACHKRYAPGVD